MVRTGSRHATLRQAVENARSGDTIQVAAGTYVISAFGDNDPGMTRIPSGINLEVLTIEWETPGQMPVIDLSAFARRDGSQGGRTVGIEAGPGNRSLTVRGLHLIGHPEFGDPYGINTNAGYLPGVGFNGEPPATLNVEQCKLVRWANGIKGTIYNRNITFNVTASVIEDCTANFLTHGIYVSSSAALNVRGCTFRTTRAGLHPRPTNAGHLIKSRSRVTVVEGCLFDPAGGCATCIETPSAGQLTATGNIILHYGQTSSSDDNPPIKYGFEESASRIVVSLTAAPLVVGDVVTGASSRGTGEITQVLPGNTYVFKKLGDNYLSAGESIRVAGVVRGTITSKLGSPDGSSNDGRTHRILVAQNTIRKDQPGNWSGSTTTAIGAIWISDNMTLDDGTPLPASSISTTVRNNIVADRACGNKTLQTAPENSAVDRSSINDLGVYSGALIPGGPAVRDAAFQWGGDLTAPLARTDSNRGGRA